MSDSTPPRLNGILQKLMAKTPVRSQLPGADLFAESNTKLTGLGVPVVKQENGLCHIDMSGVRVFAGMVEFVHILMGRFTEEYKTSNSDILLHQTINPEVTPELGRLGIASICINARSNAAKLIFSNQQAFQRHLRSVFYAVQTAQWGGLLFPAYFKAGTPEETAGLKELPALLFSFHLGANKEHGYLVLLEYDFDGKFLRLTIEDAKDSRLNLKRIHHRVVANIEQKSQFIDIDKISGQLYQAIHRECQNQQNEFTEVPARQPELFELLTTGLANLKKIIFRWNIETMRLILLSDGCETRVLLSRLLYLLEDTDIAAILSSGYLLEMESDGKNVYFDMSRGGACLNISIEQRRHEASMDTYLARMPVLGKTAEEKQNCLTGVRVLLIHHATSEMLGFIKTLDRANCAHLTTQFIKYKGIVPDNYIEALFTLPQDRFQFYSLQRIAAANSVEASYVLSNQYSPVTELKQLDAYLLCAKQDFFKAMITASAHLFFAELLAAKTSNQKLMIIEDGGYLAPLINNYCLDNKTVAEALAAFEIQPLPLFGDKLDIAANTPGLTFRKFIEDSYWAASSTPVTGSTCWQKSTVNAMGWLSPRLP